VSLLASVEEADRVGVPVEVYVVDPTTFEGVSDRFVGVAGGLLYVMENVGLSAKRTRSTSLVSVEL
jgi:hypothetical protein